VSTAITDHTPTHPSGDGEINLEERIQRWSSLRPAAPGWDQAQRAALVALVGGLVLFAAAGLVLWLAGQLTSPRQFFQSYLVGFLYWLGISLGCLVLLLIQHLTGGAWGLLLRRTLEAATRVLPLMALLSLPLILGMLWPKLGLRGPGLYEWADPEVVAGDANIRHKAEWYLFPSFFIARLAFYFAGWLLLAFLLNRWSAEQDRLTEPRWMRRFRTIGSAGLVFYGLSITLAAIDWGMSLEPHWYSTMYPVIIGVSQLLSGMAFAVAVLMVLYREPPLSEVAHRGHRRDLGSLLFAFVLIWAYCSFSQFLLIWVGNLQEEIVYPLRRTRGGWEWIALTLVIFHFALPFVLLLSRDVKTNPQAMVRVALLILVLRAFDVFWWIEPAYPHDGQYFFWLLDLGALAAIGGAWVWLFIWQLRKQPLLPLRDPGLEEALRHGHE
jgi:hypothetical protein